MKDESGLSVGADAIPDMVFRLSRDGTYLEANPGEDVEFLIPIEQFLGKRLIEVMPPQIVTEAMAAIDATFADGRVHSFRYELPSPEGVSYFEARITAFDNDSVIATIRDRTAQQEREALGALHSAVAENMAEGAALVRVKDKSIVWGNSRLRKMLHLSDADLTDFHLTDLIGESVDYETELLPTLSFHLSRSGRWLGEAPLRVRGEGATASGRSLWCELSISSFEHPDHGSVLVMLASDISERKATRDLEQAVNTMSQLLADHQTDIDSLLPALAETIAHATGQCAAIVLHGTALSQEAGSASSSAHRSCRATLAAWCDRERTREIAPDDAPAAIATHVLSTQQAREAIPGHADRLLEGQDGPDALLMTPLATPTGDIGTLLVGFHQNGPLDQSNVIQIMDALADRASPVLENARLYERLLEGAELVSNSQSGIVRLSTDLHIRSWNPGAERITGYRAAKVIGHHVSVLGLDPQDEAVLTDYLAEISRTGQPVTHEVAGRTRDGDKYWITVVLSPITGIDETTTGLVASFNDITEQRQAQSDLETMARSDSLTGLANRTAFQDALGRSLARYRRFGTRGALLFLDVDGFKEINDELGHQAGDELLCEVADRLSQLGRSTDTVARLGGDEFAVLLDPVESADDAANGALSVAQRLLDRLSQPYETRGRELRLATSCGIAHFPEDGRDPETLLKHADKAMYAAKERGGGHALRHRHRAPTEQDSPAPQEALAIAIRNGEFDLYFQPIIQLSNRELVGLEGLARWHSKDGGFRMPREFLTLAEESGLIIPLGYQLFEDACAMAGTLASRMPHPPKVAFNLSRRQFAADDLVPRLMHTIDRHGVNPNQITLEITETTVFDDVDQAIAKLRELRELNLLLALDDFGTGYSSLSALSEIAVDTLKIDRMFVNKLEHSDPLERQRHEAIILAAVKMGHSMGLTVVAEGVETAAQHNFLVGTGCDRAQGFLYASPEDKDRPIEIHTPRSNRSIPQQDDTSNRTRRV